QEIYHPFAAALNLGYGLGKFSLSQKDGRFGARIHHEHVGPELLQAPGKLLAVGVLGDKSKKIEIALRVADDAFEIVDLKQAQVPMIILNAFLLQLRALLSRKLVSLAFLLDASGPLLMIFQKRFAIVGTAAIRPAAQFHLQHAEIDSQLQFFAAIEAGDLAHFDAAALVRPISQDAIEIQTHVAKHPAFNLRLSITSRRQPSEFGRRHACRYNIRSWKIRSTLLSVSSPLSAVFLKITNSPRKGR